MNSQLKLTILNKYRYKKKKQQKPYKLQEKINKK